MKRQPNFCILVLAFTAGALLAAGAAAARASEPPVQKLVPADLPIDSEFGSSVSIDGDRAVVGANGPYGGQGPVHVYERVDGTWSDKGELDPTDVKEQFFGSAASICGDWVLVSARYDDGGSVWAYRRDTGGVWRFAQQFAGSDTVEGDSFGVNAMSDSRVIVGAPGDDDKGDGSGSAYIFELEGQTWVQKAKLVPSDGAAENAFGSSVSLSGDYAIVGACYRGTESAYIFECVDGVWTQKAKLQPAGLEPYDGFGYSVAICGNLAAVGANGDDDKGSSAGAAYVFERVSGVWTQKAKLTGSDTDVSDRLGYSVALSGETLVVGATAAIGATGEISGVTYVFRRENGVWTQKRKLAPSDANEYQRFGNAVAMSGPNVIVGAYWDAEKGKYAGAAYIYDLREGESGNTVPVARDQSASVLVCGEVCIDLDWADPDWQDLEFEIVSGPSNGTLESHEARYNSREYPGRFYYRSELPLGTDSFTWRVSDGFATSRTATCAITEFAGTGAPTAEDGSVAVTTLQYGHCALRASDPDEGTLLRYEAVTLPAHGILQYYDGGWQQVAAGAQLTVGAWRYVPNTGYVGPDGFTWRASDGVNNSGVASFSITVNRSTQDQTVTLANDRTTKIVAAYQDPDSRVMDMTVSVISGPKHGRLDKHSIYFYYRPEDGYTGPDSFTWKITDGVRTSEVATCSITVSETPPGGPKLVLLLVKDTLLPEITAEVDRLKEDLEWEGRTARICSRGDTKAFDLWKFLQTEYQDPGQDLEGAMIIGDLPIPMRPSVHDYTDMLYWNLEEWNPDDDEVFAKRNIWVSRIRGTLVQQPDYSPDEVTCIKRYLQANHDCRTGASRYPHRAYSYVFGDPELPLDSIAMCLTLWPEAEVQTDIHAAIARAGEYLWESSHGGGTAYAIKSGDDVTLGEITNSPLQLRHFVVFSCKSGTPGGIANAQLFSASGGNMVTIGQTATTSDCPRMPDYELLARGLSVGQAMLQTSFRYSDWRKAMIYGDLSLPVMTAPANQMPKVDSLSASVTRGLAPLTVNFSASASDPDGSIATYEWYPLGRGYGKQDPTASGAGVISTSHTYTLPHRYMARVQAADNYKAVALKEVEIRVAPRSDRPLRVNCGRIQKLAKTANGFYLADFDHTDALGNVWLHEQVYADGTWGRVDAGSFWKLGEVAGTDEDTLYHYYAMDTITGTGFSYAVPLDNGTYKVKLSFADLWNTETGQRLADIYLEGALVREAFDIVAEAGSSTPITLTFPVTLTDGRLDIKVVTNANSPTESTFRNNAILNCFEIVPEGGSNTPPTISNIADQTTPEDTAKGPIAFMVGDAETAAGALTISGSSSNQALVPNASIAFGGSGESRTVTLTPEPDAHGTATITVTVTDGGGMSASDSLTLTVTPVNDEPLITSYMPETPYVMNEGQTESFEVFVSDADGDTPSYSWELDGAGLAETGSSYAYSPGTGNAGPHTITVTVSDGNGATAGHSWDVTVNAVAPDPTISLSVAGLSPSCDQGSSPADGSFEVWNSGGGTLAYTITDDAAWLSCSPASGTSTGEHDVITVSYSTASLAAGTYSATVTVSDPASTNDSQAVSVTLTVSDGSTPGLVTLRARDQFGADVAGAKVEVKIEGVWVACDPGARVQLEVDTSYLVRGSVLGAVGPGVWHRIEEDTTEIVVDFWKATARARDQNGADVAGARLVMPLVTGSPFDPGTVLTLPEGYNAKTLGWVPNVTGPVVYCKFTKGLDEFDPGFQTITVKARDQNGDAVPGGEGRLRSVGEEYFADGAVVTVPQGDTIGAQSRRGTLLNVLVYQVIEAGVTEYQAPFRKVLFKALATDGVTLVPEAEIEIYSDAIPRFANNTAQAIPYDDTIRVRVRKDGVLIGDLANIAITGSSDEIVIATTYEAGGNAPPMAVAAADPTSGEAPLAVGFDGTGSSDPDGQIVSYAWDFGDSSSGTGANASHTYSAAGTYTATLTVTDDDGAAGTDTVTITVSEPPNQPPTIDSYVPETPCVMTAGRTETFEVFASDPDGDALSYSWMLDGAGTGAAGSSMDYSPGEAEVGGHEITVTVSDGKGGTTSQTWDVTVNESTPDPVIELSTDTLAATCRQGTNASSQSFTVRNSGGGTLSYTISDDAAWLSSSPPSGTSTGEADTITVSFATSGLGTGDYSATITVSGGAGVVSKTITVSLWVARSPRIRTSVTSLSVSCKVGSSPAPSVFSVENEGEGTMTYTVSDDVSWAACDPASGEVFSDQDSSEEDRLEAGYAADGMSAGTYTATFTVASPEAENSPVEIPVTLTVSAGGGGGGGGGGCSLGAGGAEPAGWLAPYLLMAAAWIAGRKRTVRDSRRSG
jgi:PKD repeat protein